MHKILRNLRQSNKPKPQFGNAVDPMKVSLFAARLADDLHTRNFFKKRVEAYTGILMAAGRSVI